MRAWQLTWTEIRRITSTRMGRLTVLALTLVPTLYAGLYLYANHDPYGALDRVPAALVVADEGTTTADGVRTTFGRDVADELLDGRDFGWHEVDRAAAEKGVEQGTYDFALVIPKGFSDTLNSVSGADPRQARLTLVTNDANSYLSTTIAQTVVGKVSEAVTQQVGEQAALTFLTGIADTRQGLADGAAGADTLHQGLRTARDGAADLEQGAARAADGAGTLSTGADELATGLGTLAEKTASLPAQTRTLARGARKVADGDAGIAAHGQSARDLVGDLAAEHTKRRAVIEQRLRDQGLTAEQAAPVLAAYDQLGNHVDRAGEKVRQLSGKLDALALGAGQVADGAEALAQATPALKQGIGDARTGADRLATGADELAEGTEALRQGAGSLHTGLVEATQGANRLRKGLADGAAQVPATDEEARATIARTIASPVEVKNSSKASADSYGEGLAPFFLALAAWIGGYVLFLLVRPLSGRALAAGQRSWRIAVGGWLAPALIAAVQMVLAVAVVSVVVGVAPQHVAGVLAVLVLSSVTFVAVIHFLCAALGSPGQFLGLVLMVVQLVSAGGTFPWQTIPGPLHWLHDVLPMPHTVEAVRLVMYGGPADLLWQHLVVLGLWLVGALVLTSLVARAQQVWSVRRVNPEFRM